jgi:hypothetical protein
MTAPSSHYFIYTGHNSYLTGNQLNSDCSILPIINALKRGVRVVELDIWPNNDTKDGVHVYHGWYVNYNPNSHFLPSWHLIICIVIQELPFMALSLLKWIGGDSKAHGNLQKSSMFLRTGL